MMQRFAELCSQVEKGSHEEDIIFAVWNGIFIAVLLEGPGLP